MSRKPASPMVLLRGGRIVDPSQNLDARTLVTHLDVPKLGLVLRLEERDSVGRRR